MRYPRIVVLTLVMVAGLLADAADAQQTPKVSKEAQVIVDLVNEARAQKKLPPLKVNALLMKAAADHSANMAKQDKQDHVLDGKNPGDRLNQVKYLFGSVGENIHQEKNAAAAFKGWMESDGHRMTLLRPEWQETGVGIAPHPTKKGLSYFTQVFAKPLK